MRTCLAACLGFSVTLVACADDPIDVGAIDASIEDAHVVVDAPQDLGLSDTGVDAEAPPTCAGAPYPIVLHHGFFGFESVGSIEYFNGVEDALESDGAQVFVALADPFDDSGTRAWQLGAIVDSILSETGACKVDLIAHSQGGVDARMLISRFGYADRVGALVTISTPHLGTQVAAMVDEALPSWSLSTTTFVAGLVATAISPGRTENNLVAGLRALSPAVMERFNIDTPGDPRVPIFSIVGPSLRARGERECAEGLWPNPSGTDFVDPLLLVSAEQLQGGLFGHGVSDGLVPISSARWGTFVGCVPADHFDEIGQVADSGRNSISGFDHIEMYQNIVTLLRERGF